MIFILGILGMLAMVWWGWEQGIKIGIAGLLNSRLNFDWRILFFWTGTAGLMFSYYRIREQERRGHKIRRRTYEEKKKAVKLPNNWEELKKTVDFMKINVSRGFSPNAYKTAEEAYLLARTAKHTGLDSIQIFFACLKDRSVAAMFSRLNIDAAALLEKVKKHFLLYPKAEGAPAVTNRAREILVEAYLLAYELGRPKVEPIHLIYPILKKDEILKEILLDMEIDLDKVLNVITWFDINEHLVENYRQFRKMASFKPSTTMDRAYTAVATPFLNQMAYDLTIAAKWGRLEFCVARDKEIEKIWDHLESGRNAVLLVGPSGVGKTMVMNGVAERMTAEDVPAQLKDKRLVELDVARLVSGANASQAEERLLYALDEMARAGNIALFIENIENLMGIAAGAEESLDLSEVLVSALEKRNLYCFATVDTVNYSKYIEGRPIGNTMAKVEIDEPEKNHAIRIIFSKIGGFEGKYGVYFTYSAIEQAVMLTKKYIHDQYLPAKAIKVLESVAVKAGKEKSEARVITREDVAVLVGEITKIPTAKITEEESEMLLNLEDKIHERMVDQEEAVKMVAASLRRARAELREGKRPIASFLFLGPTGVGKTELAKTVAEVYFGDEKRMTRLDMSEYQQADSINKMIGTPEGALGYLTEAVRKAPFSLILLDEFEKAHPDILNLFLQVMDDGRLTDGQGRTIDFTNSIIIATSNAGANFIQEEIFRGATASDLRERLINNYLLKVMRPELVNRFDGVIVFEPLGLENVVMITKLLLKSIEKTLAAKGVGFKYEEGAARILAEKGFDPKFGARPLRRLLQDRIEDEIANKLLAGELKRRDTVLINDQAVIEVIPAKAI